MCFPTDKQNSKLNIKIKYTHNANILNKIFPKNTIYNHKRDFKALFKEHASVCGQVTYLIIQRIKEANMDRFD